jgi:hypothetical protein
VAIFALSGLFVILNKIDINNKIISYCLLSRDIYVHEWQNYKKPILISLNPPYVCNEIEPSKRRICFIHENEYLVLEQC